MFSFGKKNEIQLVKSSKPHVIDGNTIQEHGVRQEDGTWIVDITPLEPGIWKVFLPIGSVYFIGVNQKLSLLIRRTSCYFSDCVLDTVKAEFCPKIVVALSSFSISEISYSKITTDRTDLGNGTIQFCSITINSETQFDGAVRLCSVTEDVNVQTY